MLSPQQHAQEALSKPEVLQCILTHLINLDAVDLMDLNDDMARIYAILRPLAVLSRPFSQAVKRELTQCIFFSSGTSQMEHWLRTYEETEEDVLKVQGITVCDTLPFRTQEQTHSSKAKWSYKTLNRVFNKLDSVKGSMFFTSPAHSRPRQTTSPCLTKFAATECYPQLNRKWSHTFELLVRSNAQYTLTRLSFGIFPTIQQYLLSLVVFAPCLTHLELPTCTVGPHTWRPFAFATKCTSLVDLCIYSLNHLEPELLHFFPQNAIKTLSILTVNGQLGAGLPQSEIHPLVLRQCGQDTWDALTRMADEREGLEKLEVETPIRLSTLQRDRLAQVLHEKGAELRIVQEVPALTPMEQSALEILRDETRELDVAVEEDRLQREEEIQHMCDGFLAPEWMRSCSVASKVVA
ncbi:hypothetical protein JCM10207_007263 [Rhodosporidiobolus poonsookiae]